MMPASIFAEALRNQQDIHIARERIAVRDHVARHYRALALPAVAAATTHRRYGPGSNGGASFGHTASDPATTR